MEYYVKGLSNMTDTNKGKESSSFLLHKDPLYNAYHNILARCRNTRHKYYKYYGGRGIKCEWGDFKSFCTDMKDSYEKGLTLDRIDNNGDYCKENCRWVTMKDQSRNRRSNIYYKGECALDASHRLGGECHLIYDRLKAGWSLQKAFITRPHKKKTG